MNTPQISILAIALAAGCAHHAEASRTNAQAHSEHPQARMDEQTNEPVDADGRADRLAVPNHESRKHLATAGHELPADKPKAGEPPAGTDPSNTRVNERDRAASALTPMDQSESSSDRELVQRIRKAVIADDSLSFTAKNVKIITRDGRVTLRGPVVNAHEKAAIEQAAHDAAGSKGVTNDLEISN
jgi:hypothetical protein